MSNAQPDVSANARIKDLEEENELLLLQLHQVQEELELYFLKYKELESGSPFIIKNGLGTNWVDDELPEALAEVERLKTLVAVQAEIKDIESRNALNIRLGNMVLEASNSVGGVTMLPFSLLSFWRNAKKNNPPKELGGKNFSAVIKAYVERGFVGVKSLLKGDEYSPQIKGNAYTALARHLMKLDAKAAAEAAAKAYEADPKPYRLKWLACRVHEAGDVLKAEAMMACLPETLTFSDSESNQARQIRYEAKRLRIRNAPKLRQIHNQVLVEQGIN